MDSRFMPEVLQAVPGDGYVIYAYFNDGTVRRYDAAKLVQKGGVFERLKDRAFFTAALTVMNGTAAWDVTGTRDAAQCIDIDPFVLYESPVVPDPLERADTLGDHACTMKTDAENARNYRE